ncbi:FGGY family carbohydrate kinase [Phytohabitans rumicis]|uniref:ATP:glycerol 3-phosphotransferase n=1 Tax=Phytohabitans rumicis TaxID=1076125 RepID=A0A6V8LBC5_9ACTN|nr:FGGY family carbohydrate kinase [Phytohabitans rumicis]GFJ93664.1 glycerol kinase [Phytohabitans rumicis]
MGAAAKDQVILAIDQGTTNTKALLVRADGRVVGTGAAPVGVSSPRPGWVEQDPERIWVSVVEAVTACRRGAPDADLAGIALSTQRESVVGWRASTGGALGPVIGWQDRRTAGWCADGVDAQARHLVRARTGLRVDPMFSAPKMRWLLDHRPAGVPIEDVRLGTIDSWLLWRLTGGAAHLCEAGNASRTLLYDIASLDWDGDLLDIFGVPRGALPRAVASDARFGAVAGVPAVPDGTPILAVLADSHAALYGHGCTTAGTAKATYGTGSSVMAPLDALSTTESSVPTTLAWVAGGSPTYALEGNILSSGAALAWAADILTGGSVADLVDLAETVPDSAGVTLVPAFAGLGAPHWDRQTQALLSGMGEGTQRAHIARAAVDCVAHQICDIVDVIEDRAGRLRVFRADGGATASALVVQTQADMLGREVRVGEVAEVSALGAARLAWASLGRSDSWPSHDGGASYHPKLDETDRRSRRSRWAGEVSRTRYRPA